MGTGVATVISGSRLDRPDQPIGELGVEAADDGIERRDVGVGEDPCGLELVAVVLLDEIRRDRSTPRRKTVPSLDDGHLFRCPGIRDGPDLGQGGLELVDPKATGWIGVDLVPDFRKNGRAPNPPPTMGAPLLTHLSGPVGGSGTASPHSCRPPPGFQDLGPDLSSLARRPD